jgi:L-aminopeptidase/D-esterase-like protein
MKGGLGTASFTTPDGLVVGAIVAVNAVGNIVDPSNGRIVAGARNDDGTGFLDTRRYSSAVPLSGQAQPQGIRLIVVGERDTGALADASMGARGNSRLGRYDPKRKLCGLSNVQATDESGPVAA